MKALYKSAIIKSFLKAKIGSTMIHLPNGESIICGDRNQTAPLDLQIHNEAFFTEIATKGGIGLGEAYQRGYWTASDLAKVLQWFLLNQKFIAPKTSPAFAALAKIANKAHNAFQHYRNRNTIEGSHENIHAHYDLGNTFYKTFLDPSMTYSSGYFADSEMSLHDAQTEKLERICRKLDLGPDHHVLEIGCGWGGFAIHAAKTYGCRVTATTISKEQYAEARRRVASAGLEDRIEITMTDYRRLKGSYDRVVSIEMLEAVGQEFLGEYFKKIEELLAPSGLAGVQVITCPNPLYEKYSKGVDWIQMHIFPGSHLPSVHALLENAESHGQLDAYHMESFGLHYARTLKEWRIRFLEQWDKIQAQGFDLAFKRKWDYYFAYCEAGFEQRHVNVCQIVFGRADETAYQFEKHQPKQVQNTYQNISLAAS